MRSERSSGVVCALLVVPFRPAFVSAHGIAAARGHEDVGRHLLHGRTAPARQPRRDFRVHCSSLAGRRGASSTQARLCCLPVSVRSW